MNLPFGVLVVLLRVVAAAAANADDASNATAAAAAAASVKMNDGARDICLMTAAATSDAHVAGGAGSVGEDAHCRRHLYFE